MPLNEFGVVGSPNSAIAILTGLNVMVGFPKLIRRVMLFLPVRFSCVLAGIPAPTEGLAFVTYGLSIKLN